MVSNGVLITVYSIPHFTDLDSYYREVESMIDYIRSSRPEPGLGEILLPGEPEFRTASIRERDGVEVDETTWSKIQKELLQFGIDPGQWTSE